VPARVVGEVPLSIIIVAWKVREMLADCLQSLADDGFDRTAEVIVVDNDSQDGTADMVKSRHPWVEFIDGGWNMGYARGNNLAFSRANGEYILILNPDTLVHRGSIQRLLEFAESNPRCAVVAPRQVGGDGHVQMEAAVNLPTVWNTFCDLTLLSKAFPRSRIFSSRTLGHWDHESDREVPAVAGSAMLVRRTALDQVGAMDATMFYAEDMDLCLRLRRAGWSIHYLAAATIVHFGGGSTSQGGSPGRYRQIGYQSLWLFLLKHHGRVTAGVMSLSVGLWSLLMLLILAPTGLLARGSGRVASAVRRRRDIASALVAWSFSSKRKFRHHLADPLERVG
jgi:GT2 family glycosyltransferase